MIITVKVFNIQHIIYSRYVSSKGVHIIYNDAYYAYCCMLHVVSFVISRLMHFSSLQTPLFHS